MCHGSLERDDRGVKCARCGDVYPVAGSGQIDLRLRRPRKVAMEFEVGGDTDGSTASPPPDFGYLRPNPNPEIDYRSIRIPWELMDGNRLTPELLSYFPRARDGQAGRMLDLGCGSEYFRTVCSLTGFEYIGMDYGGPYPMLLGDAHSLPFPDASFDFIVSFAVLEHLHNPFLAMREVARVLKPGAVFIGTVAFLEPFHNRSYHHLSHLGMYHILQTAGFDVRVVAPNVEWYGLRAMSRMGLFPHMPAWLAHVIVLPLQVLHRVWWWVGHCVRRDEATTSQQRARANTGGFRFVAAKRRNGP
jgi:SAM-dependent methyltransferase